MYRTILLRALSPLSFSCLALAFTVGCNSSDDHPPGDQPAVDSSVATDAGAEVPDLAQASDLANPLPPECPSPFTVPIDPGAQAKATAALLSLSATATLDWAPVRGTISSISGLTIPLPNCTGTTDIYDLLFDVLAQTPDLFQINRGDWKPDSVVTCDSITGFQTLHLRRIKFGPYTAKNDVFNVVTDIVNGGVILRNFSGTYIPPASPDLIATMQACADKPDPAVETALRAVPYGYDEYAMAPSPPCTIVQHSTYTAMSADTMMLDPAVTAVWEELDTIQMHRERGAILVVGTVDYTPALLNSSANCVDDNFNPQVGWFRTFDAINSKVLYEQGSPDPYCTVCFAGTK
jgi:hypothetical protein